MSRAISKGSLARLTVDHPIQTIKLSKKKNPAEGANGVSASRGNLLMLSKEQNKMYFNIRRFNLDNKEQTIKNFYNELKYALNLIVGFKDILNFI